MEISPATWAEKLMCSYNKQNGPKRVIKFRNNTGLIRRHTPRLILTDKMKDQYLSKAKNSFLKNMVSYKLRFSNTTHTVTTSAT